MASSKSAPVAATLVAIVNLVLFLPCLCTSCYSGISVAAGMEGGGFAFDPKQKEQLKKMEAELDQKLPNRKPVGIAFSILGLIDSAAMVAAAIGLLMKKPWGRLACILASVLMIVFSLVSLIYAAAVVMPPTIEAQEAMMKGNPGPAPPAGMMAAIMYGSLAFSALLNIGYPLLAVFLMMTGSVRAFYSQEAYERRQAEAEGGGRDDDRRRDDDDYDRRDDDAR
jgi:hypothetical protein